jgi:DNA-binding NarL/FixJ family response regulator
MMSECIVMTQAIALVMPAGLESDSIAFAVGSTCNCNVRQFESLDDFDDTEMGAELQIVCLIKINKITPFQVAKISEFAKRNEKIPVVTWITNCSLAELNIILNAGVRGVLPQGASLKGIKHIIDFVLQGDIYVHADVRRHMATTQDPTHHQSDQFGAAIRQAKASRRNKALTEKELLVLAAVSDGMRNKDIALTLNSNEGLVKSHVRSICRKLHAKNRVQAAMIAKESGLLNDTMVRARRGPENAELDSVHSGDAERQADYIDSAVGGTEMVVNGLVMRAG